MCSPADLRPAFSLAVVAEINHDCVEMHRTVTSHKNTVLLRQSRRKFNVSGLGDNICKRHANLESDLLKECRALLQMKTVSVDNPFANNIYSSLYATMKWNDFKYFSCFKLN